MSSSVATISITRETPVGHQVKSEFYHELKLLSFALAILAGVSSLEIMHLYNHSVLGSDFSSNSLLPGILGSVIFGICLLVKKAKPQAFLKIETVFDTILALGGSIAIYSLMNIFLTENLSLEQNLNLFFPIGLGFSFLGIATWIVYNAMKRHKNKHISANAERSVLDKAGIANPSKNQLSLHEFAQLPSNELTKDIIDNYFHCNPNINVNEVNENGTALDHLIKNSSPSLYLLIQLLERGAKSTIDSYKNIEVLIILDHFQPGLMNDYFEKCKKNADPEDLEWINRREKGIKNSNFKPQVLIEYLDYKRNFQKTVPEELLKQKMVSALIPVIMSYV